MIKLSIVIPCRNEANYIARCLESIINCDFSKDELFVFVCDGMSSDETPEIVRSFEIKYPYIKLIQNKYKTTPYALNLGINESDSEYITILGAHAEVNNDYFTRSIKAFELNENIACTGGLLTNQYHDAVSNAIGNALSSSFGVGDAYFRTGKSSGYVDTVAFGTYKRIIFNKIGFFDEDLARNQDDEFNFRLLKNGYKIYLDKEIIANYYVRASLYKLWRQYWQYGYWKVFVNVKHNMITTLRQLVPLIFVLFVFIGAFISLLSVFNRIAYLLIWIIYLFLGIYFAFKKNSSIKIALMTLISFIIVHFGYGLGYLAGILRFVFFKLKPGNNARRMSR